MRRVKRQAIIRQLAGIGLCAVLVGLWFLMHRLGPATSQAAPSRAQASVNEPRATGAPPAIVAQSGDSAGVPLPAAPAARSPAETAALLHTLHERRDYTSIAPLIVADRRGAMLDLLMSIDDLLLANDELQGAARQAYGGAVTDLWDLSAMANNLGPFSAKVTIINQSFVGDTGLVTLQEGENVPLARAQFDWTGESWQYRPEATPAQLLLELSRLAGILRDIAESAKRGASFDDSFDAFAQRAFPQMRRIVTASDRPPDPVAAGPPDAAD